MSKESGLAGKIRRVQESDEFDLGGFGRDQCYGVVKEAFTDPFELPGMVKITFVCGGGKNCRQKYGDDLVKDFCQALDSIGFDSDSAACTELSAAGRYKYQHDTSKNLKFVHVFPRITLPEVAEGDEEVDEDGEPAQGQREPADVLAVCDIEDFRRMVGSHVTSYAAKKRLFDSLKEKLARLEECEQKMIAREEIEASLQKLYDTLTAEVLKDKVKVVAAEMQASIDAGELTAVERSQVIDQLDGKLSLLETELKKAEADGKEKLKAKLEEQKDKLKATKVKLSDGRARDPPPLKYADQIQKMHKRLIGLARLEKESAGKYTLDQLKALGEKPDMEEAMSVLQNRSRMWFESDEEFKLRVRTCLAGVDTKPKKASGAGNPAGSSSGGWQTQKKK